MRNQHVIGVREPAAGPRFFTGQDSHNGILPVPRQLAHHVVQYFARHIVVLMGQTDFTNAAGSLAVRLPIGNAARVVAFDQPGLTQQYVGINSVSVVQRAVVGYDADDEAATRNGFGFANQHADHGVDFFQTAGRFLAVYAELMGAFVKTGEIRRQEERLFFLAGSQLVLQQPRGSLIPLSVSVVRQIQASGVTADICFHFGNQALRRRHGVDKGAVHFRAVPPEFRRDVIALSADGGRKGRAAYDVASLAGRFPKGRHPLVGKPVPRALMARRRVEYGVVDDAVGHGVRSRNHALVTRIGKRREDAFHALRRDAPALQKIRRKKRKGNA